MEIERTPEEVILAAIQDRAFPGAAWAFGGPDALDIGFAGSVDYSPDGERVTEETVFDLASLTKVIVTTTAAMQAVAAGKIRLEDRVQSLLPEWIGPGKDEVTFWHLLTHSSGLAAHYEFWLSPDPLQAVLAHPLERRPGHSQVYSCIGFLVLWLALGTDWNGVKRSFGPWGELLTECPDPALCAPTEVDPSKGVSLRGVVHDENARCLGGLAGNAGLFGTIRGVAQFAQASLCASLIGVPAPIQREFRNRVDNSGTRALGWDTKSEVGSSAGALFGPKTFGHTGFTGTSIWIDPEAELFAVLLSNRVHPTRQNLKIQQVRPAFHDAVYRLLKSTN